MEDRSYKQMSDSELKKLNSELQNELDNREKIRKEKIREQEEQEAEANLKKIEAFLELCSHKELNKCSDDDLKENAYSSYGGDPEDIKCIRCYLLSCKYYSVAPQFRLTLSLEKYKEYGE